MTDREAALTAALRRARAKNCLLDAVVDNATTAVALWTPAGEITYANTALLALWGFDTPDDVVGAPVTTFWRGRPSLPILQTAVDEAGGWIGKLNAVRGDDSHFTVMLSATLIGGDGATPPTILGCFLELTYREQLSAMLWRRVDRLRAIQRIDRSILAARRPEDIAEAALTNIRELIPCDRACVVVFDRDLRRAEFLAAVPEEAYDLDQHRHIPLAGLHGALDELKQGRTRIFDDLGTLPLPPSFHEMIDLSNAPTVAAVPLTCEERLLGLLTLAYPERSSVDDRHLDTAREIADSLAVAIRQSQLNQALASHGERLQDLTARLAEAEEAERRRLARELHDQIGQKLTALGINLNVIKAQVDPDHAPHVISRLDDSLQLLKETTERVRRVIADLRPPMLDDYGLLPTLRWCASELRTRVDLDIRVVGHEPDPRLGSPVEDALVRITQEALTNVAKHAHASSVTIKLVQEDDLVRLTITDDGVGLVPDDDPDQPRRSWGLVSMRERAQAVGGTCSVKECASGGTKVTVKVKR